MQIHSMVFALSRQITKTINLLCACNKIFVTYQTQGGVIPKHPYVCPCTNILHSKIENKEHLGLLFALCLFLLNAIAKNLKQSCNSGRVFRVGPGSGLSLQNVLGRFRAYIQIFCNDEHLCCQLLLKQYELI